MYSSTFSPTPLFIIGTPSFQPRGHLSFLHILLQNPYTHSNISSSPYFQISPVKTSTSAAFPTFILFLILPNSSLLISASLFPSLFPFLNSPYFSLLPSSNPKKSSFYTLISIILFILFPLLFSLFIISQISPTLLASAFLSHLLIFFFFFHISPYTHTFFLYLFPSFSSLF